MERSLVSKANEIAEFPAAAPGVLTRPERSREHKIAVPAGKSTPLSQNVVCGMVAVTDVLVVLGSGLFTYLSAYFWHEGAYSLHLPALVTAVIATSVIFQTLKLYSFDVITRPDQHFKRLLSGSVLIFVVVLALSFAMKISSELSRLWMFTWFILLMLLVPAARFSISGLLRTWAVNGRLSKHIVLIGGGEQAARFLAHLNTLRAPWYRVIGIFDDRVDGRVPETLLDVPVLGNVSDALNFAREHRVDDIILTLPWSSDQRLAGIIARLRELPVHIRMSSDLVGFSFPPRRMSMLHGVPIMDIADKPLGGWSFVAKAIEDRVLAFLMLILFAPVLAVIAIAIKLDSPGPILFRQPRYGFNNQLFSVYKFRTMFHGPPKKQTWSQATKDDPRVTRVGKLLRRTSLDELPQILNVLLGNMSVVGPRPHPIPLNDEYAKIITGYAARHRVKPGITGWAQVNGFRGETDVPEKMKARVEHDIYYIEHWSLALDLQILVMTLFVGFVHENAY